MKKILTTVGTSIFTNYMKGEVQDQYGDDYSDIFDNDPDEFKDWERKLADEYPNLQDEIEELKNTIKENWFNFNEDNISEPRPNTEASAEIKSILAIAKAVKEDVEVFLLATDTVLSRLACELIKEWFSEYKGEYTIDIQFNEKLDVIPKLQILDQESFEKEGLVNLIHRFNKICGNYFDNVILNITGGYKAIIPYITILGQVNKVPVKYIFEDTDTLIEIPLLPLTINENLFEQYEENFLKLELGNGAVSFDELDKGYDFVENAQSCLDIAEPFVDFHLLGRMLWKEYRKKYFFFYASDEVWTDIQNQPDIQRILRTKFHIPDARQNKTEKKQSHYVYDDGDNNNRIYYFEVDGNVYIYKTFESESKAKAFINTPFEKKSEIGKAKLQKIDILP